jgi:hypothetical protein
MQRSVSGIGNTSRKERTMKKFDTLTAVAAVLDIPAGRIRFIAADRVDTTVEILPTDASKTRDLKMAEQTDVTYDGDVLRIVAPAGNQLLGPSGSLEVTVQLPAGSRIEGKAAAAEFRAVGRFGDVAFDAAQGNVKIDEAASARLSLQAGDVTVGRLTGPARISTGKGAVTVAEAVRGEVELRTEAGDISIGAAAGVSASLDAGTSYGRIQNSLNNSGETELTIQATTAYGNISARSL